ncbi:MAG: DNA polymerase III subunit beta [Anaerolineaceae bacterium 4572_5.1]|nr:MAG: DNA polymerase III subunit beta [Anaerolineaceae bacterium 4572_5.1]
MKNNPTDLTILPKIFSKYPDIQAVYLFGSSATGKTHMESDLDLGIYSEDQSFREKKLDILTDLAREGFCDVDLAFLNTKDILLKYEVVRHNNLVYQREDFDAGSFFSLIMRQYNDFYPYLKVQREAYKRRILDDGETGSYRTSPEEVG